MESVRPVHFHQSAVLFVSRVPLEVTRKQAVDYARHRAQPEHSLRAHLVMNAQREVSQPPVVYLAPHAQVADTPQKIALFA